MPTAKAFQLMTLLRGLGVEDLTKPELTGDWEYQLAADGARPSCRATPFMAEIAEMTEHIVAQAKEYERDTIPGDFATLAAPCPKCGGEVHENYKKFQCVNPDCDFAFWKILGGRQLEPAEVEALIARPRGRPARRLPQQDGPAVLGEAQAQRRERSRSSTSATRTAQDDGEAPDFSGAGAARACPKCGSRVFEHGNTYVCEKAVGPDKTCDFRSGRMILQRPSSAEQMQKLLATGKTDLLQFVSARTRRPFSAFLVRQRRQGRLRVRGARTPTRRAARDAPRHCARSARIRRTSGRSNCTAGATGRT